MPNLCGDGYERMTQEELIRELRNKQRVINYLNELLDARTAVREGSPLLKDLDAITEGKSKLDLAEEIWRLSVEVERLRAGWIESNKIALEGRIAAAKRAESPEATPIAAEQVEWVVNDIAELGVKIGNQFFWLYKGHSLVYGRYEDTAKDGIATHDDGTPMRWRPVGKREFGECCHPVNYADLEACGHPHYIGTVSLTDSDEWKPLPAANPPPQLLRKGDEQ